MSTHSPSPRWWEGGTLHDKTLGEWLNASEQNRMATTVDILFALREDLGAALDLSSGEALMARVLELMACISGTGLESLETHQLKIADLALLSARALGYLGAESVSDPR
jgi:hypothetical protein